MQVRRTSLASRSRLAVLAAAVLGAALLVSAMAQDTSTAGSTNGSTDAAALRRQAVRLELLNALPEDARGDATALLDRIDAHLTQVEALESQALEARVAALEAGEPAQVAQLLAVQSTIEARIALAREGATLQADVAAFVEAHPDAAAIVRYVGRSYLGDAGYGALDLGRGMTPRMAAGQGRLPGSAMGPGDGAWPGMRDMMRRHR